GVRADRLGPGAPAGEELRPVGEKGRGVAIDRLARDLHRLVRSAQTLLVDELRQIRGVAPDHRAELRDELRLLATRQVDGKHGDAESGNVPREDIAVAIGDAPP